MDGVLTAGTRAAPLVTFRSLKRQEKYPPFNAGPLGESLPRPKWEQFALRISALPQYWPSAAWPALRLSRSAPGGLPNERATSLGRRKPAKKHAKHAK
jgi:hypothetical protein